MNGAFRILDFELDGLRHGTNAMSTVIRKKRFVLGRRHNGMLMTPEEFDAVTEYDNLYSYELINGVLVVNAFPSRYERDPNDELGHWLRNYQAEHPGHLDKTVFEEYIRTKHSRRRGDRVIWAGLGRGPDPETEVPTIAIEFVSRRRRDWLRDYEHKRE
jgi:Uma2 family endonuclease